MADVAVVDEQQMILPVSLAFLFNICIRTNEGAFDGFLLHEVVGEEVTVHVAGLDDLETDGLRCLACHRGCEA